MSEINPIIALRFVVYGVWIGYIIFGVLLKGRL